MAGNLDFGKVRATLSGNVNNLFDQEYIADARDGGSHNWETATRVLYGFGLSISFPFITVPLSSISPILIRQQLKIG